MIGFDSLAKDLPWTQEVILAKNLLQSPRPHSIGKGSLSLEQFFPLLLKKIRLLLQLILRSSCQWITATVKVDIRILTFGIRG